MRNSLFEANIKANFVLNVVGMTLPIGVTLLTVPIYIAHIGAERYGVLSIVWLLLGYFGFLDFGLSRAATKALAALGQHSALERSRVFGTALYLNFGLGVAGALILYFVGGFFVTRVVTMSDSLSAEVNAVFPWIACMLPLALVAAVGRGSIEAREDFFAANALDVAGNILGQVVPLLCAVFISPTLNVVIPAAFAARALSVAAMFVFIARTERARFLRAFDPARVRELFGFGAWVSITNVVGPLLTSLDQLFISSSLGAAAVAHYSVPMNLVVRSQIIATALARTLFPRFARLNADDAMELAERTATSLAYTFAAICAPTIIVANAFMTLWMGAPFASYAGPVAEILMVGAWFNGVAFIPFSLLQAQGRPDLVAKLHTLELAPFIAILWLLLQHFGLPGAALAWVLRVAIDALLLFDLAGFRARYLLRVTPAFALLLLSYLIGRLIDGSAIRSVLVAGAMVLLCGLVSTIFDAGSRQALWRLHNRLVMLASWQDGPRHRVSGYEDN